MLRQIKILLLISVVITVLVKGGVFAQQNPSVVPKVTANTAVSLQNKTQSNINWNNELSVHGKSLVEMTVTAGDPFISRTGKVASAGNVSNWSVPVNTSAQASFRGHVLNADTQKHYNPSFTGNFQPSQGSGEPQELIWNVTTQDMKISNKHEYLNWEWKPNPTSQVVVVSSYTTQNKPFSCSVGTMDDAKTLEHVATEAKKAVNSTGGELGRFLADVDVTIQLTAGVYSGIQCHADDTCQFAQQCERICNVNIVFTGQINLPQWDLTQEDMSNINKDALAEWNRFLNKLKEHEEGHAETMENFAEAVKNSDSLKRKIWLEACSGISQVKSKNMIIQSLNTNELQTNLKKSVWNLLIQKLQEQENQYDSETNHGANQGAVLTTTFRLHE